MQIKQYTAAFITLTLLTLVACKKDDPIDQRVEVTFPTETPEGVSSFKLKELTITAKEVNTAKETKIDGLKGNGVFQLDAGVYEIQANGRASYLIDGQRVEGNVVAYLERQQIDAGRISISLKLFLVHAGSGFVIEEVFFTGNNTPENELYLGDRYLKIYNNSADLLYADGLVIASTTFTTVEKYDYKPNIIDQAVAVDAMMMIPGNGTQYPVQPGASIIIAEKAINHKEFNVRAFDLSKADFEMVNQDEDVDNPAVKNMINFMDKVVINNRGFQSFVIARIPVSKEAYLSDYTYDYSYPFVFGDFKMDMEKTTYKIPNDWIIDAVNLSVQSEFKWIVTSPALDKGWTYCGKFEGDESRFGKSVKRKTVRNTRDGKATLRDINDSSIDFEPEATPSLKN